ncbi:TetR/AcrR family transcriptional regulator [Macrococcus capreoli]
MRQDAKENYIMIKQHAAKLFATHGVEHVSMQQIAKSLNIGPGTLYRHFADKGVLCFHLLEDDFNQLFDDFDDILATEQSNYDKLDKMLNALLKFKYDNEALHLCIEQHEMKYLFKATPHYKKLYQSFEVLFKEHPNAVFITDMLLNALTTRSFQHQIYYRKNSLIHFKDNLLKLYGPLTKNIMKG